ncbi:MAG: type II toxin-antitoxin system RelE/ParE family toxin [Isosphaerales bacterium]
MAAYQIEVTEDASTDLSHYSPFERRRITSEIRAQLTNQPSAPTRNRKLLRDNPIARWELRVDKYRIFYEVDEDDQLVTIVAIGHKDHEVLVIRGEKVQI